LLKKSIGIKHKFLGKPLQIATRLKVRVDLLIGPRSLGVDMATAYRSIDLLCGHAGDQAAAVPSQGQVDAQLITTNKTPSGVEEWELAATVLISGGTHQFQRSSAATLMLTTDAG
jgi:hypothetical protein